MDLYSLGELVIDFTPGSEPASYIRNPGGAPANAAITAARSGKSCSRKTAEKLAAGLGVPVETLIKEGG